MRARRSRLSPSRGFLKFLRINSYGGASGDSLGKSSFQCARNSYRSDSRYICIRIVGCGGGITELIWDTKHARPDRLKTEIIQLA